MQTQVIHPTPWEMTWWVAQEYPVGFSICCVLLVAAWVLFMNWHKIEYRYYFRAIKLPASSVRFYASFVPAGESPSGDITWSDHWSLRIHIKDEAPYELAEGMALGYWMAEIKKHGFKIEGEDTLRKELEVHRAFYKKR